MQLHLRQAAPALGGALQEVSGDLFGGEHRQLRSAMSSVADDDSRMHEDEGVAAVADVFDGFALLGSEGVVAVVVVEGVE